MFTITSSHPTRALAEQNRTMTMKRAPQKNYKKWLTALTTTNVRQTFTFMDTLLDSRYLSRGHATRTRA